MTCQRCKGGLGEVHYLQPAAKGARRSICENCFNRLMAPPRFSTSKALLRTLFFSGLASVICGFVAALPIAIFTVNTAIVWIFLGAVMGRAVVVGSEDRGDWYYRLIGLASTWCAIGLSWLFCFLIWTAVGPPKDHKDKGPISQTALVSMLKPGPSASATPASSPTPAVSATPAPAAASEEKAPSSPAVMAAVILFLSLLVIVAGPILVAIASPISILIYLFALHTTWKTCARESRQLERVGPPIDPERTDWSRPDDAG